MSREQPTPKADFVPWPPSEDDNEFVYENMDAEDDEEGDEKIYKDKEDLSGKAKGGQAKQVSKQKQTLFIKNLPTETTPEQIKALSADIVEVRMDVSQNKSEKNPKYAYLEFANPEMAEKNLQMLRGQTVEGSEVYPDFVDDESFKFLVKQELSPSSDPLKLYVTGFGRTMSINRLISMFPTSTNITLPLDPIDREAVGYAYIHYDDPQIAKKAHDSMQAYVYEGEVIIVMYARQRSPESAAQKGKRKASPNRGSSAKKSKKNEDEDEEDEDEEEDEEEDPEDEDEEIDEEEDNE